MPVLFSCFVPVSVLFSLFMRRDDIKLSSASFWEKAARSVNYIFSLYYVYL